MSNAISQVPTPNNEIVKSYGPGSPEKTELKLALSKLKAEKPKILLSGKSKELHTIRAPHLHELSLAQVELATAQDLAKAVERAVHVQKEWADLPWEHRAGVFLKAADLLATKYRARMNAATMLGQSKTPHQAEIDAACELIDFLRFNVAYMEQIYRDQPRSSSGMWNRTEARGLEGFVLAITPFNFTSIGLNLACAPALMGCSVIWKPALTSMLSSFVGMEILHEAGLPEGVIQMLPAPHELVTAHALKNPNLAGVHFTGSTPTFNFFWKTIGQNMDSYKAYPRIVGETGGKDFVFAHASADVDELCTALVRGAFEYQGQKCSAASRAYIPKSLWGKLKTQLVDTTESIKMGNPEDFRNFMGAVIDAKSYARIKDYIDHATKSKDAQIIAGGTCDDQTGYFIRPTIIETSNPHYRSMVEEIFGPVLTVFVYDDQKLEETLALCDTSTSYALTGAIFARDRHVIHKLTERLRYAAGNFYINDKPTGAVVGQQPFGGGRASGTNDKAGSYLNLVRWMSVRTIKENFLSYTDYRYPFMSEE